MISNSKKWAQARGLVEKNEVHGQDEWRIPIKREFEFNVRNREEVQHKASYELEAGLTLICMQNIYSNFQIYNSPVLEDPDGDMLNFGLNMNQTATILICYIWPCFAYHVGYEDAINHFHLRNGQSASATPASSMNQTATASATQAKMPQLPVLQSNQEPLSTLLQGPPCVVGPGGWGNVYAVAYFLGCFG